MRLTRASGILRLLALTIIASPLALAQDSGGYLGGNFGKSKAKIDDVRITSGLLGAGFATQSISDHDSDTAFKVFLGYQFNKYFAIEGGYFDLGTFGFDATTLPPGVLTGTIQLKGFNLDAVLTIPFTEKCSAFARVGLNNAEAKDTFSGTGMVHVITPNPSKRETNPKFGVGLQYDFTRSLGMRLEAERYRINDAVGNKGDVDHLSAGLLFRFGRTAPAPAPVQVAVLPPPPPPPAPPAPIYIQQPVAVLVPAPVKMQKYCTILDIQFEIDEAEIQREEKEKLKVVAAFLNKYPETTGVIEGHTDNVGTYDHNLKLSQRRAESVVAYLVETYHIAPARLTAVGYGDSRPLADNSTQEGKRENRRIGAVILCATDVEGLTWFPARITMAMLIEFDKNDAEVKPEYDAELQKVANMLKANPTVTATVEGHTGNLQVSPTLAMEISQRRAQNVVNHLVDKCGISRSRLTAEGFGSGRRFAYNTTAEGQQENRRVNIIFNYPKQR